MVLNLFIKNFKVFYRPYLIKAMLTIVGMTASEVLSLRD